MGTHHIGDEREVRALDTYIKLMRATDTLGDRLGRHLAGEGLTMSQLGVLEALLHLGPLCHGDLGDKLLRSSGNITLVVNNLERQGLVVRERTCTDRRRVTVTLTAAGRTLISRVFPAHAAQISEALGVLDPAEQQELARLCKKLGTGLG